MKKTYKIRTNQNILPISLRAIEKSGIDNGIVISKNIHDGEDLNPNFVKDLYDIYTTQSLRPDS